MREGNALRKPMRTEGEKPIPCFCNHASAEHGAKGCTHQECSCQRFQARPCACGHPYSAHTNHNARCTESGCSTCKGYRPDGSPEFLLRQGVRAGEWKFITQDQLRSMMRPGVDPTVRVWACGMLHVGPMRRLAVKKDKHGKWVALQPDDLLQELNAVDTLGRMDKQAVRRELYELESMGMVRLAGPKVRKNRRLYFYQKPLPCRSVPDLEEQDEEPDLVVCTDYQTSASDTENDHLQISKILALRGTFGKTFLGSLRKVIESQPNLVVPPDYQKVVDQTLDEVMVVVQAAYQKLVLVVCPALAYKEVSSKALVEGPPQQKGDIEREKSSSSAFDSLPTPPKAEEEESPSYQTFKTLYPAGHFDEPKTRPAFGKLSKAERSRCIWRLRLYLECPRWKSDDGRWIPLSSNWLKSYEADPPPLLARHNGSAPPSVDDVVDAMRSMREGREES